MVGDTGSIYQIFAVYSSTWKNETLGAHAAAMAAWKWAIACWVFPRSGVDPLNGWSVNLKFQIIAFECSHLCENGYQLISYDR